MCFHTKELRHTKIVLRPTQEVGGLAADQWKYSGKVMCLMSVSTGPALEMETLAHMVTWPQKYLIS